MIQGQMAILPIQVPFSIKNLGAFSALSFILTGNAVFVNYNAFHSFNFFDMSIFMNAGWRILRGQRPYIDFIRNVSRDESFLVLTNMQVLYGLTGRDSYRGIPYTIQTFDNVEAPHTRSRRPRKDQIPLLP